MIHNSNRQITIFKTKKLKEMSDISPVVTSHSLFPLVLGSKFRNTISFTIKFQTKNSETGNLEMPLKVVVML